VKEKIEQVLTNQWGRHAYPFQPGHGASQEKMETARSLVSKTKGLVNVATKSKEEIARLAAKTIAQKLKDAGVPTDLCWRWYTTGECRWSSCVHNLRHTEQYRGQGGKPDEGQKNEAVAEADGPVPGTKGLNCKKKPQYL
jgi:hypothetical protein